MSQDKIFHVMHILGNLGMGGAEIGVLRLIQSFPDDRFKHSITIIGSDLSVLDSIKTDLAVHSLDISGRSYTAFLPLKNIFQQENVDIVHVNNLAPWFDCLMAARMAGCRCVETFHGVEKDNLSFSTVRKKLYRFAARLSDTITAVAKPAAYLLADLTGISLDIIKVIPNGIDINLFVPSETPEEKVKLRKEKGLPENNLLFGCVAALRPVKNHHGLLQAFTEVIDKGEREATLVLVGEGSLEQKLRELAKSLGIENRVCFLGRRNDINELLRCFDVFVLNSQTEGLSYAVLEAMASGLPVVATSVGENTRLISDEQQGYLVAPDDVTQLTDILVKVAKNTAALPSMGSKARSLVAEKYSMQAMVSAYQHLYEELILQK